MIPMTNSLSIYRLHRYTTTDLFCSSSLRGRRQSAHRIASIGLRGFYLPRNPEIAPLTVNSTSHNRMSCMPPFLRVTGASVIVPNQHSTMLYGLSQHRTCRDTTQKPNKARTCRPRSDPVRSLSDSDPIPGRNNLDWHTSNEGGMRTQRVD